MLSYFLLFRIPSPFWVQTKIEENTLPARSNIVSIVFYLCYTKKLLFEPFFNSRFSHLQKYDADDFKLFYPR